MSKREEKKNKKNKEPIRILLVDDDEDDYIVTRDLLSDTRDFAYRLEWVETYNKAGEMFSRSDYDVYLIDYRLGDHTGLELLRNGIKDGCKSPIIMLTGQGDHEVDLEAMNAGASDYLVKGQINPSSLERSIRYSIERKKAELEKEKLIKELKKAIKEVKKLSGMLPICASCKKIRDDLGYWRQVEEYIEKHADVEFTHGICPECLKRIYPNYTDSDK